MTIERVAKALSDADRGRKLKYYYEDMARAALEAIATPTPEMRPGVAMYAPASGMTCTPL